MVGCRLIFFHRWGKWEKREIPMKRWMPQLAKFEEYVEESQQRVCIKCGRIQRTNI